MAEDVVIQENMLSVKFGLSLTEALIVARLLTADAPVTPEELQEVIGIPTPVRHYIYRIRPLLKPYGVTIMNRHRVGYWLVEEDKKRLLSELS